MSTRDIIDDIDALIDEQLAAGETGQERRARTADRRCWHCGREWHGLAITKRLEEMRDEYRQRAAEAYERGEEAEYATSAILDGYRYDQDDSDILCPGSDFIGPMPATMRPFVGNPHTGCTCPRCQMVYGLGGGYSPGGVITCDSPGAVIQQRGDETTFDFTPDDAPPRLSLFGLDVFEDPALPADANSVAFDSTQFTRPTNRATRRRNPPRQDPYWVQRADRRRGRQ